MVDSTRLLGRLEDAAVAATDLAAFWRAGGEILLAGLPGVLAPCFFTVDPESRLVTSHFQEGLPEIPAEWLGRDYLDPDYNSMSEVLASSRGYGTLHEATGGRPEISRKLEEEMRPFGCDQELVVALRTRQGDTWGALGLYREQGRALFDPHEIALVLAAAPVLAEGARRALLTGQAADPDLPDAPGLVVVDDSFALVSASPTAATWLRRLGGDERRLPVPVLTVAGRVLEAEPDPAVARVAAPDGSWVTLQGTRLEGAGGRQAAVVVEAAQPAHLTGILMRVHGLTAREQEVTRLVIRGLSTTAVARRLAIAEDTVQKHVQNVFAKTGARSRGELVGLLFATHYEPRVRDNERRVADGRPSRHGPMPA